MFYDYNPYINYQNTYNPYTNTNTITRPCTHRDEKYASIALIEAQNSNMKYHQHGCIAVIDGKIIARGWNSYGSQPNDKYLSNSCSCHAEVDVMRKIERLRMKKQHHNHNHNHSHNHNHVSNKNMRSGFLGKISMYVVRRHPSGEKYKDSAPCARCTKFMKSLNIKNIIYSNEDGSLTKIRVRDYETNYNSQGTEYLTTRSMYEI
jgi:deoxycytidylate deaminase